MRRRILIAAGVAAGSTATVAAALIWGYIPYTVRQRVSEVAERRGLVAEVDEVSLSFSDVSISGVRVRSPGDALQVEIGSVHTGAGIWELAMNGSAAVRSIRAEGVHVRAELDSHELEQVVEDLRGSDETPADERSRPTPRTLAVSGLTAALRDRDGLLVELDGGTIGSLEDGSIRIELGPLVVGSAGPDSISLERSELVLERAEDGPWQVGFASAASVDIRYEEREADEASSLLTRIVRHVRQLRRLTAESSENEDRTSDDEEEESRVDTLARVAAAAAPRLGQEATMRLDNLSVTASSAEGEHRVLRELEADVRALSGGRFRLEGSGRPGRGGRLGWNILLDPEGLRAEGDVYFQRVPFVLMVPFLPDLPWHESEDARVSGDLTITGEGVSRVHLEGRVAIDSLGLSSPRIAPNPVQRISASIDGEADWDPLERHLEVARAELTIGRATAIFRGSVALPEDHYRLDLTATLPPTECNTALSAIPAGLLADATAFTMSGRIGGRVVVRVDSRDLQATQLDIDVADGCVFETAPRMADVTRFEGAFTHRVIEPDGTTFQMETGPGTLQWTPISQVSPFLVHAVLGHEDSGFFRHEGFATFAIRLALIRNLTEGRYVYGASTITMQLVKNVFLHREKTLARKIQEVLLTWWIESVMAKEQILELYLNVIEYGPEIYGIRSAAHHYFGRAPSELGPAESAYLATILPNPKAFHAHWEEEELPASHRRRTARFLRTLGSRGRYDAEAVARGLAELEDFRFYHPGRPLPPPPQPGGSAAPLPIVTAQPELEWHEFFEPDDPDASPGPEPTEHSDPDGSWGAP